MRSSEREESSDVTGEALPPASETRSSLLSFAVNRITPSRLQVPGVGPTSAKVSIGPPDKATFFSLPPEENPINRPSGDQKGNVAFSVPGSGSADGESSARIQSCCPLEPTEAMNASLL